MRLLKEKIQLEGARLLDSSTVGKTSLMQAQNYEVIFFIVVEV